MFRNVSRPANPVNSATAGALAAASEQRSLAARRQHRRDVRLRIILPMVVGAVVSVLFLLLLAIVFSGRQVGIVASFSLVIIIVPVLILCLIPYALLIVGVAGMGRVYKITERLLGQGQRVSRTVHVRTAQVSKTAARPFIIVQRRLTWLDTISRFGRRGPRA